MYLPTRAFIVLLLTLLTILDPIAGKRSFGGGGSRHSYPRSGGLSGGGGGHRTGGLSGGGHGYPSSGGMSGGSHGYPSGGGLSGGNHGYPSSGGSHGYPSANKPAGSGYPSSGNNHGYPSGGGLSGNSQGGRPGSPSVVHHTTHVHNNYHYTPPAQISYASPRGGPPVSYPVYHGTPPNYVYQYKDSGSKYGTLLAGLALMNLGTLGVAAYAVHQANSNHGSGSASSGSYTPQRGEICKFAVKKENGDYEETRIDCQIISSFILQDMQTQNSAHNSSVTTTVTNVTTIVNTTNVENGQTTTTTLAPPNVLYAMLPNGTLVPVNVTLPIMPQNDTAATQNNTANTGSSVVVTTTTTNTTVVNALDVKGKPVDVTPGMQCFVIRNSPISNMRKAVPCGVLQMYADKSLQRNSAARHVPMFTIVAAVLAYCVA